MLLHSKRMRADVLGTSARIQSSEMYMSNEACVALTDCIRSACRACFIRMCKAQQTIPMGVTGYVSSDPTPPASSPGARVLKGTICSVGNSFANQLDTASCHVGKGRVAIFACIMVGVAPPSVPSPFPLGKQRFVAPVCCAAHTEPC